MQLVNKGEAARQLIGQHWLLHQQEGKSATVTHFMAKGFSRSFVYAIIRRAEKLSPLKTKPRSGRPVVQLSPNTKRKLRQETVGKVATSYRNLSLKYGHHHNTMRRIMTDMSITRKKRKTAPKTTEKQIKTQKQRLRLARRGCLRVRNGCDIVMDDESYFSLTSSSGSEYYYEGKKSAERSVKYREKKKVREESAGMGRNFASWTI